MDSSQSLRPNGQRHKDDVVPIVTKEGSTAEEAQFGGPTRNPDGLISTTEPPIGVDVTAELTAPPQDAALQPAPVAPQAALAPVAAATSSEAIRQLETLARVAVVSGPDSSDQALGRLRKNLTFLPWEPSINVSPRDQLTSERPSIGRPTFLTLASASIAALIAVGATFAWQSRVSTTKSSNDVDVAAEQAGSTLAGRSSTPDAAPQRAPVTQTAAAPTASATSPELVQQLEAMARDLTVLRHSVEQIAVKQERLAAAQERLEQLAAKQEQMAQDIAKLQAVGQNIRQKLSPRPLSRTVPVSPSRNAQKEPKDTPPETAAQSSSVPRPEPDPRPPLPVPLVR